MFKQIRQLASVIALFPLLSVAPTAMADKDSNNRYEVTITNLTRAQQFTPILAVSHKQGLHLFELGKPASAELRTLAEMGNTAPLAAALALSPDAGDIVSGSSLTDPGASTSLIFKARGKFDFVSVAAMLIPTNDGFFAADAVELPRGKETVVVLVPAYDAGTERNDELCASIPGPLFAECGGSGGGGTAGNGEGHVFIHAGMHDIGDMVAANRDWRNPVARIEIRRVR